jgi:NADPH-dependent F420 reductase
MKISVLGTGRMGRGLVKSLAPQLDQLIWGSRSPEQVKGLADEIGLPTTVKPAAYEEALQADIVIPAMWFRDLLPWARENRQRLAGKIVVDIVNPFTADFTDFTTEWGTSAAEELQRAIPQSRVVGAFKNTFFRVFDAPVHHGVHSDVYVTSDDGAAKQQVMELIGPLPFRVLDGGSLKNNRTIERMTLFEREVALRYGHYPYVSFRLFGMDT